MRTTSDVEGGPAFRSQRAGQWLRRAFGIFLRIDGTQRAGAFAHFAFFSLFPAIILMNVVYGALGGVIALLLWIYLSGVIFIFGACLCAARAGADAAPRSVARA